MSELTLTVVRLGLLALLWVFVFSVVGVLRGDLFGTRVTQRASRNQRLTAPHQPSQSKQAPRKLVVTDGPLKGTTVTLSAQSVLIGRSPDVTLVLSEEYISGHHARIYPDSGEWYVEDLGSTNGTYLGDQKLTQPSKITDGSVVRIGSTTLESRR
ncbi:MAG: FHA domain-containing protein FhaB/FipA [Actinomycetota bacterium]